MLVVGGGGIAERENGGGELKPHLDQIFGPPALSPAEFDG